MQLPIWGEADLLHPILKIQLPLRPVHPFLSPAPFLVFGGKVVLDTFPLCTSAIQHEAPWGMVSQLLSGIKPWAKATGVWVPLTSEQKDYLSCIITSRIAGWDLLWRIYEIICCFSRQVMSNSFATPWALAGQASLSMGFPRREYWSGLPFPSLGDLPNSRIESVSPALAGGFFTAEPTREALMN